MAQPQRLPGAAAGPPARYAAALREAAGGEPYPYPYPYSYPYSYHHYRAQEEDEHIVAMVGAIGTKWSKVAAAFEP